MKKTIVMPLIWLHLLLILYSFCAVLSKSASNYEVFSQKFIICYVCVLIILFIYAIFWQLLLKKFPLSVAFANKGIILVWGMVWGKIIFNENISLNMIIGIIIVFLGICVVVFDNE